MTAQDIVQMAADKLLLIGPALLVFSGLAVADLMLDFVLKILNKSAREYRL